MALSAEGEFAAPRAIDVAKPAQKNDLIEMLRRMTRASGRKPGQVFADFLRLNMGPGKLNFDEYAALSLYDPVRHVGVDTRAFVGYGGMSRIWDRANYRQDLRGLLQNKVAMTALLAAHGLPTLPIAAFYSEHGRESAGSLNSKDALVRFLERSATYPLFGKPMDSYQSLGSASFERYDEADGMLIGSRGSRTPLAAYAQEVAASYGGGYIFQPRVSPHPETKAICGERLSTVRVLTMRRNCGAKIFRACEKIPGGENVADNYWRAGNLLVQLDLETGRRLRAISGKGFDLAEHATHPDSGAAIVGTMIPNWDTVRALALEGAEILADTPLIGWDIAAVEDGAVVVEVNCTPDLMLPQLADARGVLDAEMRAFLEECRGREKAWQKEVRAINAREARVSFRN